MGPTTRSSSQALTGRDAADESASSGTPQASEESSAASVSGKDGAKRQDQLDARADEAQWRLFLREHTACCGARALLWQDDGNYETTCDECDAPVCEACASFFEVDGGYGEDGRETHVSARCKDCKQ